MLGGVPIQMGAFTVYLILIAAIVFDFFWLDVEQKRWGWMKNWSRLHKGLFFSGFIAVTACIYIGLSLNYM